MRVVMTGQLFHAGDRAGPQFTINETGIDGPYLCRVISHLTGEILAIGEGFKTIGEACEWVYEYAEY